MSVALKVQIFDDPLTLATFCATSANNVTTVVSVVTDNSGKYVLFYT